MAASEAGYSEMEDFLVPTDARPRDDRIGRHGQVHRAGDADVPAKVDIVLYQQGLDVPEGAYEFRRDDPASTVAEILTQTPRTTPWRSPASSRRSASASPTRSSCPSARENALFADRDSAPQHRPEHDGAPWALGEFASDTAFLTANQIRMAFQIAAACGQDVGFSNQKGAVVSIVASAFGWRALARELAGQDSAGRRTDPQGRDRICGHLRGRQGPAAHSPSGGAVHPAGERVRLPGSTQPGQRHRAFFTETGVN